MPIIDDLINNPNFKAASPEEQQDLVIRFHQKYGPQPPQVDMDKGTFKNPLDAPEIKAAKGAAMGYLTGGGPFGAAYGMANPPESAGDYTNMALSGLLSRGGNELLKFIPPGLKRTLATGAMGGLTTEAVHAGSELADRFAGSKENKPLFTDNKLALALGILPPAAGESLISNLTRRNPVNVSNEFMNQQIGRNTPISQIGQIATEATNPNLIKALQGAQSPGMQANQLGQEAIQTRIAEIAKQKKLAAEAQSYLATQQKGMQLQKAKITADKLRQATGIVKPPSQISPTDELKIQQVEQGQAELQRKQAQLREVTRSKEPVEIRQAADDEVLQQQLENTQRQADIIRQQAEAKAAGQNMPPDPTQLKKANIDVAIKTSSRNKSSSSFSTKKLDTEVTDLTDSLTKLKDDASRMEESMNPLLRKVSLDSPDPQTFIKNFMDTGTPEAIKTLKAHMTAQPNGARNVQTLQDSMLTEFFKRAYDPKTKTLANASALFGPDGSFSADKIGALYGPDKVVKFRQVFEDIQRLQESNSTVSGIAGHSVNHFLGWSLPMAFLFHSQAEAQPAHSSGYNIATGAAVAAGAFATIMWPRLVNGLLKNPKTADTFHKWATSTRPARSLKNWPSIAAFLKDNSDPVEDSLAVNDTSQQ